MKETGHIKWTMAAVTFAMLTVAAANAGDTPSVAEQMAGLQTMCAESEQARAQRQADRPLYDRLGGYDRIHEFTREVVRLHKQNDSIKAMFEYVDAEDLAKNVADFVASGTGGPQSYTGGAMPAVHAKLTLTDADFLSAGVDIVTAMQTMEYGQNEIDEMVCILVSLKDQVVLE
jgi:hemoglobin